MTPFIHLIRSSIWVGTYESEEWLLEINVFILDLYYSKRAIDDETVEKIEYYYSKADELEKKARKPAHQKKIVAQTVEEFSNHFKLHDPGFKDAIKRACINTINDLICVLAWYKIRLNDALNGESTRTDINRVSQSIDFDLGFVR